jgi:hypothetical protein
LYECFGLNSPKVIGEACGIIFGVFRQIPLVLRILNVHKVMNVAEFLIILRESESSIKCFFPTRGLFGLDTAEEELLAILPILLDLATEFIPSLLNVDVFWWVGSRSSSGWLIVVGP